MLNAILILQTSHDNILVCALLWCQYILYNRYLKKQANRELCKRL